VNSELRPLKVVFVKEEEEMVFSEKIRKELKVTHPGITDEDIDKFQDDLMKYVDADFRKQIIRLVLPTYEEEIDK